MSRNFTRAVFALLILSVFLTPFQRDLFVGDETKYSKVVREIRTGAFFVPTLEGAPFTHKPPLHFWLIDGLTHVFGVYSTWSFVLPSIAAFLWLLWLVARLARRAWPDRRDAPALAALVCGTTTLVWGSAQTARMDVTFTALLSLAALLLLRFLDGGAARLLVLAAATTGLALLVKGPMAPVIMLVLVAFEWWRRKRLPHGPWAWAGLTLLAVPLLWLVPAVVIGGDAFMHEIFFKQTVGRAVGAWVHKSPPWFYILHGPATVFPWFFALAAAGVAAYKSRDERAKFAANWLLAVLVPYSIISSKLDVYMMALVPPMALLIAWLATSEEGAAARFARIATACELALLALIGVAAPFVASKYVKPPDDAMLRLGGVRGLFAVMAVAGALGALFVWRSSLRRAIPMAALALATIGIYIGAALVPLANDQVSSLPLVAALARQNVPGDRIALFTSPHLWTRDMPPSLESVRYVSDTGLASLTEKPLIIATSRRYAHAIAPQLAGYRKVDEVRMIGKWFDIYRWEGL